MVLHPEEEIHHFSLTSRKVLAQAGCSGYIYLTGGDQEYKIMAHEPEFRYYQTPK